MFHHLSITHPRRGVRSEWIVRPVLENMTADFRTTHVPLRRSPRAMRNVSGVQEAIMPREPRMLLRGVGTESSSWRAGVVPNPKADLARDESEDRVRLLQQRIADISIAQSRKVLQE